MLLIRLKLPYNQGFPAFVVNGVQLIVVSVCQSSLRLTTSHKSTNEFLQLASDDIYQNDFLKRKFTDILTNRLPVAFCSLE